MPGLTRERARRAMGLLALGALLCSGPGWAATRVALVVGNSGYAAQNIPALPNPVNDARLIAGALETSGFEVRLVTDADQGAMREAIEAFGERLERAGAEAVGLFYYAGHGVEVRGQNYLIPIGAEIEREVEFKTDAVPADWVLSWMEAAGNRLNLVILDACRNNPYEGRYRGASQGLAQMDAPSGSLIAYSAAPGQLAVDGEGENSPYTAALAGALAEPGLKVEDVFKRVRVAVEGATNGQQTPWESSSLRGDFFFVAKAEEPRAPEPVAVTLPETLASELTVQQLAARAYEAAERLHTVESYQLVVEQFPGTLYAKLAEQQLKKLTRADTPPAPSAEEAEAALGLTRAQRRLVQRALNSLEFDVGAADGLFGPRTRAGLAQWQEAQGAPMATGYLDAKDAETLLEAAEALSPPESQTTAVQKALDTLNEALTIARGIADAHDRAQALSAVAEAQTKAGDAPGAARSIAEALAIAQSITHAYERAQALSAVAEAQTRAGDALGAARSIAEALATARGINSDDDVGDFVPTDVAPRVRPLIAVAEAQAKAGDISGARRSISEALATSSSDFPISETLASQSALVAVAGAQAKLGDIPGALATVRSIRSQGSRLEALSAIAEAQARLGDAPGAAQSITQALVYARQPNLDVVRIYLLSVIAEAQARLGDAPGAAGSIAEAEALAAALQEEQEESFGWFNGEPLSALAGAQAKLGDFPGAFATARGIQEDLWRARAFSAIAEAQVEAARAP